MASAHEGAPGRSHGGVVAALFDDVFGFLLTLVVEPAFTGELTVRYEAGVPIGVPLTCRVRITERVGTGERAAQSERRCPRRSSSSVVSWKYARELSIWRSAMTAAGEAVAPDRSAT
jgi:hypothetical protein